MNKNILLVAAFSCFAAFGFAQIKVVAPNGDTGIGTDSPTEKLDVDGKVKVRGSSLLVGTDITSGQANVKVGVGRPTAGSAAFDFVSNLAYPVFGLRLLRDVNGTSRFSHRGSNPLMFATNDAATMHFLTNNTIRMSIQSTGEVNINGSATVNGGVAVTSDKRLKKDIVNYKKGLEEVLKINPVVYNYTGEARTSTERRFVGVIAQDLQKIAPEFVSSHMYKNISDSGEILDQKEYLKVHDSEIKYLLVNAIKEQSKMIDDQASRIEKLENQIEAIIGSFQEDNQNNGDAESEVNVYLRNNPNPFTQSTSISYNVGENSNYSEIRFVDATGRLLEARQIENIEGSINIDLSSYSSGVIYANLVTNGKNVKSIKLLKM